jgi:hypothetical protein
VTFGPATPPVHRHPMFVHDFTSVPIPVDDAIRLFTGTATSTIGDIVATAWNAEAPILDAVCQTGLSSSATATAPVTVIVHGHRLRRNAAVAGVKWAGSGWLPDLDADLELVGFGHDTTHLHLLGRYEFPPYVQRDSEAGSLIQRLMVLVVRNVLVDLGDLWSRSNPAC